jgi:hypothetical protein
LQGFRSDRSRSSSNATLKQSHRAILLYNTRNGNATERSKKMNKNR